jgi:hypothetical protein
MLQNYNLIEQRVPAFFEKVLAQFLIVAPKIL